MRVQTYTGRTHPWNGVYAHARKSLVRLMGLKGVEPLTSRLSATRPETGESYTYIEGQGFRPRAPRPVDNRTSALSPAARTQGVHAKADSGADTYIGEHLSDPAYFVAHVGVVWCAAHVLILAMALLALAVTP